MADFRPISQDRAAEVKEILQYGFMPERGPEPDAYSLSLPADLFDLYGLFDGDDLVSVCKLYDLETTIRSEPVTVGGLGAVATAPERRRQGHVRELLENALGVYRERDVSIVTLWPSGTGFYRNLGWGIANTFTKYELPPEKLAFARGSEGAFRRLSADGWERLRAVETTHAAETTLALRRSEAWWRQRTLADWAGKGTPYLYGYERDGGLQGYLVYTIDRERGTGAHDASRRLQVQTLAYADDEAYRAILDFLADQDSQVDIVELLVPEESDLLYRIHESDGVEASLENGSMVRLTDVPGALESFPWPDSLTTSFTLRVTDPLVSHNDGTFAVDVDGNTATVTSVDADDASVTTDIATLSQLYVGTFDIEEAERLGTCEIDESVRGELWTAFTPEDVCLREFF